MVQYHSKMHKEEIEIEKKVWKTCFICESDYSEEIKVNNECLHSYCKACIEDSATTSMICPICHIPLPSPLSSLPINYTLQYWRSLSPPQSLILEDTSLNEPPHKKQKLEVEKLCEECGNNKIEKYCSHCKCSLCSVCSDQIHALKIMKSHDIISVNDSTLSPNILKTSKLSILSPIMQYDLCDLHNLKEKELYCEDCNECICSTCIGDSHQHHRIITVINKVDSIKNKWKERVHEIFEKEFNRYKFEREKFISYVSDLEDEIERLEGKLLQLKQKKSICDQRIYDIDCKEEKKNFIARYLTHFIETLPALPLSSFILSPKNNSNINNNVNNENNNEIKKRGWLNELQLHNNIKSTERRIKEFFEEDNLINNFSYNCSLTPIQIFPDLISQYEYSTNECYIPTPLSFNEKLKLTFFSDEDQIRLLDSSNGSEIESFDVNMSYGVRILLSLNLLAISIQKGDKNYSVIEMYDLMEVIGSKRYLPPSKYTIKDINAPNRRLGCPGGLAFSEEKGLLALCDQDNKRIVILKITTDSYDLHSIIPLHFKPYDVSISSNAGLILITRKDRNLVFAYKIKVDADDFGFPMKWEEEKYILLHPIRAKVIGIAINSSRNYFVICDRKYLHFYNLTTYSFIRSIETKPYFEPWGISIDEDADIIAVAHIGVGTITYFRSPVFD